MGNIEALQTSAQGKTTRWHILAYEQRWVDYTGGGTADEKRKKKSRARQSINSLALRQRHKAPPLKPFKPHSSNANNSSFLFPFHTSKIYKIFEKNKRVERFSQTKNNHITREDASMETHVKKTNARI